MVGAAATFLTVWARFSSSAFPTMVYAVNAYSPIMARMGMMTRRKTLKRMDR